MFVSDAPLRTHGHQPGCRFGPGFFKVVWDDHAGERRVLHFDSKAEADIAASLLPYDVRRYRDSCLDAPTATDAGTPDVVDGDWWLGLPKAQAMEELGITDERHYATVHRMVSDMVAARDNRASQGGVRAPIVIRRKKRRHLAHLFEGGGYSDVTRIGPEEYDPLRGS